MIISIVANRPSAEHNALFCSQPPRYIATTPHWRRHPPKARRFPEYSTPTLSADVVRRPAASLSSDRGPAAPPASTLRGLFTPPRELGLGYMIKQKGMRNRGGRLAVRFCRQTARQGRMTLDRRHVRLQGVASLAPLPAALRNATTYCAAVMAVTAGPPPPRHAFIRRAGRGGGCARRGKKLDS